MEGGREEKEGEEDSEEREVARLYLKWRTLMYVLSSSSALLASARAYP